MLPATGASRPQFRDATPQDADGGGHLGILAVPPRLQARGIGRALLDHAEGRAVALWGCRSLTLTAISLQEALPAG